MVGLFVKTSSEIFPEEIAYQWITTVEDFMMVIVLLIYSWIWWWVYVWLVTVSPYRIIYSKKQIHVWKFVMISFLLKEVHHHTLFLNGTFLYITVKITAWIITRVPMDQGIITRVPMDQGIRGQIKSKISVGKKLLEFCLEAKSRGILL